MSMIGNFRSVSDEDIRALLEQPQRVTRLLYGEEVLPGSDGSRFLSWFNRGSQTSGPDTWEPGSDGEELDVDKAWHGIHFLLTGTAWEGDPPLNFIVSGGKEIGNVDVGYGPARALTSEDVRRLAAALEPLQPEEMRRRFDPDQMIKLQIYPEIWDRDASEDDTLGYLIEYYSGLREFVRQAADRGLGLVVYIN